MYTDVQSPSLGSKAEACAPDGACKRAVQSMAFFTLLLADALADCGSGIECCHQCTACEADCRILDEVFVGEVEMFLYALERSPGRQVEAFVSALERELAEGVYLIKPGSSPDAIARRASAIRRALCELARSFGGPVLENEFKRAVDRAAAAVTSALKKNNWRVFE